MSTEPANELSDQQKVKALVAMLLAFRRGNVPAAMVEIIDQKLAEVCPQETAEVEKMIQVGKYDA